MAKKIEFIDSYIVKDGMDYEFHDNHGTLTRCKDCKWWTIRAETNKTTCGNPRHHLAIDMDADDYCSRAERK